MSKETFERIEVHPDVRLALLAVSVSGMIGDRAYKTLFDLKPEYMRSVAVFLELLADAKEKSRDNN